MPADFLGDDDFTFAFAAAFLVSGSEPGGRVGTEHLLYGATLAGPATELLDAFELTPTVARAVLRSHRGEWVSADVNPEASAEPVELVIVEGGDPVPFTPAAAAAMRRCTQAPALRGGSTRSPADVLSAVLEDEQCRATELATLCTVDPAELRRSLRSGAGPTNEDRVPAQLRATRDALIGRRCYPGRGLRQLLMSFVARARVDYGQFPVLWASFEADAQARRHRGRVRSDDIILALLAIQEVADSYPHLTRPFAEQYAGSRALTQTGLDHLSALRVVSSAELGTDPVPPQTYLGRDNDWPADTASLLRRVLADPAGRASRLLDGLGVNPQSLSLGG